MQQAFQVFFSRDREVILILSVPIRILSVLILILSVQVFFSRDREVNFRWPRRNIRVRALLAWSAWRMARRVGRPGERTRSGYWKGIKVNATQTVRYA